MSEVEDLPDGARSVEAAALHRLPKLVMAGRQLEDLPEGVWELKYLLELDLSDNSLKDVPIGSIPGRLQVLTLTANQLGAIPGWFHRLRDLQKLFLSGNRIASCSGVRFGPSLLHVGLGYNQISSVAGIANDAEALLSLDLSHNNLEDLQATLEELAQLPQLRSLSMSGNPFCIAKNYRDLVKSRLPRLRYFDGKKLEAPSDAEGDGKQEQGQDPLPERPHSATRAESDVDWSSAHLSTTEPPGEGPGTEIDLPGIAVTTPLNMELRSLVVKDPDPPRVPEWVKPSSSDGNKPKKGKQDDAVPAVPPVMYYVEYEDLDGGAVGSFTAKKVEIDPQAVAEAEAKQASQSTAERPGSKGSSKPQGGAADNKDRGSTVYGRVLYQVQANAATRDWLRNGFKMKLWRVHLALRRKVEAEATEKEPEKFSYWLEEEEKLLGTGTCRAPELIEGASTDCRLKVQFIEPPRLWDEKDLRMALHDERHRTEQTGSIVVAFQLHYEPPKPEPLEEEVQKKGGKKKK